MTADQDRDLLDRLAAVLARVDEVPAAVRAAAVAAQDAQPPAGARLGRCAPGERVRGPGAGRTLHFGAAGVRLVLALEPAGPLLRLTGVLHAADPDSWLITAGQQHTRTDRAGRFTLTGLRPGPLRLTATHPAAPAAHTPWFVA